MVSKQYKLSSAALIVAQQAGLLQVFFILMQASQVIVCTHTYPETHMAISLDAGVTWL